MPARNSMAIEVAGKAVEWIAAEGYDPRFGVRPVKRLIRRSLLNGLSKRMLAGQVVKAARIVMDVRHNKPAFVCG